MLLQFKFRGHSAHVISGVVVGFGDVPGDVLGGDSVVLLKLSSRVLVHMFKRCGGNRGLSRVLHK